MAPLSGEQCSWVEQKFSTLRLTYPSARARLTHCSIFHSASGYLTVDIIAALLVITALYLIPCANRRIVCHSIGRIFSQSFSPF